MFTAIIMSEGKDSIILLVIVIFIQVFIKFFIKFFITMGTHRNPNH